MDEWYFGVEDKTSTTEEDIEEAIESLEETDIHNYLERTADAIAGFDWRSADGPAVKGSDAEMTKRAYRGTGGYAVLTVNVLKHISEYEDDAVADAAGEILPAS